MFSDSYFTISGPAEGVFKDRGSRFIAYAFPVTSETEIKTQLIELRNLHPSARHHCYAWMLGADRSAWRANDDGEPSGSAGKPILGQINANDLTNVLIVVVRYFGGTLLGVGGLINAYRSAAATAITAAGKVECFIVFEYEVLYSPDDTSAVMRLLKELNAKVLSNTYDEQCRIQFQVKKKDSSTIENKFSDLYTVKLNYIKTH